MREYKIKRGYYADLDSLVSNYFGVKGELEKGINLRWTV